MCSCFWNRFFWCGLQEFWLLLWKRQMGIQIMIPSQLMSLLLLLLAGCRDSGGIPPSGGQRGPVQHAVRWTGLSLLNLWPQRPLERRDLRGRSGVSCFSSGLQLSGGVGPVSRREVPVPAAAGDTAELRDWVGHGERRLLQEEELHQRRPWVRRLPVSGLMEERRQSAAELKDGH